jgi:hypothetical protein
MSSSTNQGPNQGASTNTPTNQAQSSNTNQTATSTQMQTNLPQTTPVPRCPILSAKDIPLTPMFISDPTWPASLTLDLQSSNWAEWSRCLEHQENPEKT